MDKLEFTEIFPYKAQDLIDLVMDAEKYADISKLIKRIDVTPTGDNEKTVKTVIETPVIPVAISYECTLAFTPPDTIVAQGLDSSFKEINGRLQFSTLPNGHTQVDCLIEYETGWSPVAIVAGQVMQSQIDKGIEYARDYLARKLTPIDPPSGGPDGPQKPAP